VNASAAASLRRDSARFVAVGLFLLAVDSAAFAMLHAFGVPTGIANIVARFVGTVLGFWLHGRITFGGGARARMGYRQMGRYVLVWCALTALSTGALAGWEAAFGSAWLYLAKPAVEFVLAGLSFFALRHFVYRP
jgi:putative flippase GtrA